MKQLFNIILTIYLLGGCSIMSFGQGDTRPISPSLQQDIQHIFSGAVRLPKNLTAKITKNQPSTIQKSNGCGTQDVNRTYDGTCNNVMQEDWGTTDIKMYRDVSNIYNGNEDLVRQNEQTPRQISNKVFPQAPLVPGSSTLSSFVFTWGQFLDHDITLTPESHEPADNAPIPPTGEAGDLIVTPIPFHRSAAYPNVTPREQINGITAWVDASNVYGSDAQRAMWLRTLTDGKLKVSTGDLLPYNTIDGEIGSPIDGTAPFMAGFDGTTPIFVAGDVRANEQPGLLSMHTLFVREHNRICDELLAQGMTQDEEIYQKARKLVGAIMQVITYQEFLLALGVSLDDYAGYDNAIQPDIRNSFATAAYRLGHTMITEKLLLIDDMGTPIGPGALTLREAFFSPQHVANYGIEPFFNGLARQFQEEVDAKLVEEIRSFLFAPNTPGPGLDLAALNIQRGRDHGLSDYLTFRQYYTGTMIGTWSDITNDVAVQTALAAAYSSIHEIDPWVGLLAEDHLTGSNVGITLYHMLKKQFEILRDCDYYYYENDPSFTTAELDMLRETRLSDIILRNTNIIDIQENVFYPPCETSTTLVQTKDDVAGGIVTRVKVSNQITASNNVEPTAQVLYNAGESITLTSGFHAKSGSSFYGLIKGCDNTLSMGRIATTPPTLFAPATPKELQTEAIQKTVHSLRNYPNPFTGTTTIEYTLTKKAKVSLSIFDPTGRWMQGLITNENQKPGTYRVSFNGNGLPNGIYLYRLKVNQEVLTKRMILAR